MGQPTRVWKLQVLTHTYFALSIPKSILGDVCRFPENTSGSRKILSTSFLPLVASASLLATSAILLVADIATSNKDAPNGTKGMATNGAIGRDSWRNKTGRAEILRSEKPPIREAPSDSVGVPHDNLSFKARESKRNGLPPTSNGLHQRGLEDSVRLV